MTRTDFRALVVKCDPKANEAVAVELGWRYANAAVGVRCRGHWLRRDEVTLSIGLNRKSSPSPYATCSDSDPRSWPLFGEMWEKLVTSLPTDTYFDLTQIPHVTSDMVPGWRVHASHSGAGIDSNVIVTFQGGWCENRCAACAEALLAARGKFEKE